MSKVLPDFIHVNQTGFIKDRHLQTNRRICLLNAKKQDIDVSIMAVDAEKALDRLEWAFLSLSLYFTPFFDLVSSLQLPNGFGRGEGREPCVLRNMTRQTALLNTHPLNLEASCTNVSEEPLSNLQPKSAFRHPARHMESLEREGTRRSWPAKWPLTWTTLGQLCAASWVSRSRPAVTQPGIEPGPVVTLVTTDPVTLGRPCVLFF